MRYFALYFRAALLWLVTGAAVLAQDLTFATVTRVPFSQPSETGDSGFSVDLMQAIAADLGQTVSFTRYDTFSDMLGAVEAEAVDGAIANISITASREATFDFSQPMFDSGIQVMLHNKSQQRFNVFSALMTYEFAVWAGAALSLLFGGGLLMWFFERGKKSWFDRPASEALFPSFWWALNLMLNGGFEERMPNSRMGSIFAVFLVVSSLFFVSIFVAQITAALTVKAISENVENLNDLDGKEIGTLAGSTSSTFLDLRGLGHRSYMDLETMLTAFEDDRLDAVVFDGPILAYYAANSNGDARVLDKVYRPENYGIVFPSGSPLREQVNLSILKLREEGIYDELLTKWFGAIYR